MKMEILISWIKSDQILSYSKIAIAFLGRFLRILYPLLEIDEKNLRTTGSRHDLVQDYIHDSDQWS